MQFRITQQDFLTAFSSGKISNIMYSHRCNQVLYRAAQSTALPTTWRASLGLAVTMRKQPVVLTAMGFGFQSVMGKQMFLFQTENSVFRPWLDL